MQIYQEGFTKFKMILKMYICETVHEWLNVQVYNVSDKVIKFSF